MIKNMKIENCNGCEACIVACKQRCIKTVLKDNGEKEPVVNMDGCTRCNACRLYCPLFNPVELPEFEQLYNAEEDPFFRNMPPIYRETMRLVKNNQHAEFMGTLCQIAGLKSLLGDVLPSRLQVIPIACDQKNPRNEKCAKCEFYK